jgi:hypothetical protein
MASRQMSMEEVEKEIRKYISSNYRTRGPEEAYDFNIKVRLIDVPEIARHKFSEAEIDQHVQTAMADRLRGFANDLLSEYPCITDWQQEGRTGGWLVLITHEPAIDLYDEIQKSELVSARNRLKDLFEIDNSIRENIKSMQQEFSSLKWWGIGPLDWLPGMKRR